MNPLTQRIDHTLLKPEATFIDIEQLCHEARQFQFFAVCVNPFFVSFARDVLESSPVQIATVVGFPTGMTTTATKVFETSEAIKNGANEIDMVITIGAVKSQKWQVVEDDIRGVVDASQGRIVKVIFETALLTKDEILKACDCSVRAGAQFVKTSTGFSTRGASVEDVRIMRSRVGNLGVKASGGIKTLTDIEKMIEAGATRIGTSSAAKIFSGLAATGDY